jgi:hypothetical protein
MNSPGTQLAEIAESMPADARLRMEIRGPDFDNIERMTQTTVLLDLGEEGPGAERLERQGILVVNEGDQAILEEPFAGTPYFTTFQMFEFYGDEFVTVTMFSSNAIACPRKSSTSLRSCCSALSS